MDLNLRVVGQAAEPAAAASFLAELAPRMSPTATGHTTRLPGGAIRRIDRPEVEILFLPGSGNFSGRAEYNIVVALDAAAGQSRIARRAHVLVGPHRGAGGDEQLRFPLEKFGQARRRVLIVREEPAMQIAIVARTAKRKGGTESYLFDLVRGFTQAGHSVDVFTAVDAKPSAAAAAGATVQRIPLALVPATVRPWLLRMTLAKRCRRRNYDLTISLARVNGQDLAICGGTHRGYLAATGRQPGLRDRSEIALEERCYRESGLIVAHSCRMQRELLELYDVEPAKVLVIHPPVDSSIYFPGRAGERTGGKQSFGLAADRTTLLFPSTGHERKGLPLLLDALATLPADQFELAVAGSPSGHHRALPNVKYLGFITSMADLYRAADVTVLPSHYEPFGLVVTESLACGTPVVTYREVGACDVIGGGQGVVLNELSVPALRDALLQARRTRFQISPNFVSERGLQLPQHIERLALARAATRRAA